MKLKSIFLFQIPNGVLLISTDPTESCIFEFKSNGYEVRVDLNPKPQPRNRNSHKSNKETQLYGYSHIKIEISRNEDILPLINSDSENLIIIRKHIDSVREGYINECSNIINRLIDFFKYKLHNPNLHHISQFDQAIQNPTWCINGEDKFPYNHGFGIAKLLPKPNEFGILYYSDHYGESLQEAVQNGIETNLVETLLSESQNAIFENNLRRGALELAIATEVMIKNAFFEESSIAGEVIEYLSGNGKLKIRVLDLISDVAKSIFGKSFKDENMVDFDNICSLVKCRNRIAHNGKTDFLQHGVNVTLTLELLKEWWNSVFKLSIWLDSNKEKK